MLAALDRYHIAGISTTIPFCSFVLRSEAFRSGNFSTNFVREQWVDPRQEIPAELLELAAAAAVRAHARIEARIVGEG
jgi:acetyl/propionyl-CoA carboxylase alpha subunit